MAARAAAQSAFYSLAELNTAIGELLGHLNEERPIRRLGATRRQLLEEVDRPRAQALTDRALRICEWRARRVGIDYHVDVGFHYLQRALSLRSRRGRCAADRADRRDFPQGRADRRAYADAAATASTRPFPSICRPLIGVTRTGRSSASAQDARLIGPAAAALCELILENRPHPEQGFRACLGIVRLAGPYRRRTGRSRRRTRHRDRRENLRLGQIHPRQQARSASRAKARRGRNADPARQYPRPALLPLGEAILLKHPTLDQLHALGLYGMAKAFVEISDADEAQRPWPS